MRVHLRGVQAFLVVFAVSCASGEDLSLAGEVSPPDEAMTSTAGLEVQRLSWLGDTHLRYDGQWIPGHAVLAGRPLEVYTQTWPAHVATRVHLFWRTQSGAVLVAPMTLDLRGAGKFGNNLQWRAVIPARDLVAGQQTEYWIRAEDMGSSVLWDSDQGRNLKVTPSAELAASTHAGLWRHAGRGGFETQPDGLVTRPGDGLGLTWYAVPTPPDFELSLEFQLSSPSDNSGVVLRFRDPERFGYDNAAWVGVHDGLEVQIDDLGRPDGAPVHRTGAFYEVPGQVLSPSGALVPGQWNRYVISVRGDTFAVTLNGQPSSSLHFAGDPTRPDRARATGARFFGLQSHTGTVAFRNVRLRALE